MKTQTANPIRLVTRAERLDNAIHHAEVVHRVLRYLRRPTLTLAEQGATVQNGERYRGPKLLVDQVRS